MAAPLQPPDLNRVRRQAQAAGSRVRWANTSTRGNVAGEEHRPPARDRSAHHEIDEHHESHRHRQHEPQGKEAEAAHPRRKPIERRRAPGHWSRARRRDTAERGSFLEEFAAERAGHAGGDPLAKGATRGRTSRDRRPRSSKGEGYRSRLSGGVSPGVAGVCEDGRTMKLFVTGAAGFIGSNYVRHVLETSDDEVTVYDALTYAGNREPPRPRRHPLHVRPGRHLRPRRREPRMGVTMRSSTSRPRATSTGRS